MAEIHVAIKPIEFWSTILILLVFGSQLSFSQRCSSQEVLKCLERITLQGFSKSEIKMGVRFRISLYATDAVAAEAAFEAAFEEIDLIEKVFTDYDPSSEVNRLCHLPAGAAFPASSTFIQLTILSRELHSKTGGYFDVTLGRLTKVWRQARRLQRMPTQEEVNLAKDNVGMGRFLINEDQALFRKGVGDFDFDFGGIAKGYAADRVLIRLKKDHDIQRVLVDASGDLTAGSPPPGQRGWVVGLAKLNPRDGLQTKVYLVNSSLASSGDANQFLQAGGVRRSHLINPLTKQAVDFQHVTIVHATSGSVADGLASALSVCPSDKFQDIVQQFPEAEAFRVTKSEGNAKSVSIQSTGWEAWLERLKVGE